MSGFMVLLQPGSVLISWIMLPSKVMRISVVCAATWSLWAVLLLGEGRYWFQWSGLPSEATVTSKSLPPPSATSGSEALLQQGAMIVVCVVARNWVEAHAPTACEERGGYMCRDIDDCRGTVETWKASVTTPTPIPSPWQRKSSSP